MSDELKAIRERADLAPSNYLGMSPRERQTYTDRATLLPLAERAAELEARVEYLQVIIDCVVANCEASASSYQERIETIHRVTSALALEWADSSTLKAPAMAVDYEEGRRLLAEYEASKKRDPDGQCGEEEWAALQSWFLNNRQALLNPDPWRPISEMTDELRDGRPIEFCDARTADWFVAAKFNADATLPRFPWYTEDGISYQETTFTHFRELKGPGQ